MRRLQKSYRKRDVNSSESESQAKEDRPLLIDSPTVSRCLAQTQPLKLRSKCQLSRSRSLDRLNTILEIPDNDNHALPGSSSTRGIYYTFR